MRAREVYVRVALFVASALSMLWGFRLLLTVHAPDVFNGVMEDLSYGWYVPVFSLYVLWREKKELVESVGAPSPLGIALAVPSLLIGWLGAAGGQIRFEILGFVGLLLALVLATFGRRTARQAMFPILFLLFCMPLHSFLDVVTIHLRLLAVSAAQGVLNGLGVNVVRSGTMLASANGSFSMDVADPCSGLRSLFAMLTLSAGYGYFTQPTWTRRALLFALSVPIAVAGNVVRIVTIAIVGATCSADFASGFYHDYSGYVVFLVAVSLMVAAGGAISRLWSKFGMDDRDGRDEKEGTDQPGTSSCASTRLGRLNLVVPLVAAVLVICTMAIQGGLSEPALCEAPKARLGEIAGFKSEAIPPSEAELETLPKDTAIEKRGYVAPDGNWYNVSLIVGGRSKGSIHRPEMCLPSQGFLMADPVVAEVSGVEWRMLTVERGRESPLGFAYTFFNQDGFRTSSHVKRIFRDVVDRSFLRRIDRWAMVTVTSSDADRRRLERFLSSLKEVME